MNRKQLTRRELLKLGAMTVPGLMLAACQSTAEPQPTTASEATPAPAATQVPEQPPAEAGSLMSRKADGQTISVWGWDKPEFCKVIDDYVKESSGVTVNYQSFGGDDLANKITTSAAAGAGLPDGFRAGTYDVARYADMKAMIDVTDLAAPYKDIFPQVAWDMCSYQGKIWMFPSNSPAAGLFWRYDVCEQYGIDPDAVATWDDFVAAGQKITQDSGGSIQMVSEPKVGLDAYVFDTFRMELRADVLTSDETVAIGPDSQAWKSVLSLARQIKDAKIGGQMDEWTEPWYQAIKDGTLAVIPSGTWFVETIKQQAPDSRGKWYFTMMPGVTKDGDRYPNYGGATFCISPTTEKVDAVMEWIKGWTMDPKGSFEIGMKELGISAISKAAREDPWVDQPHEFFAEDQAYWRLAAEAFEKITYVPPVTKDDSEASSIYNTAIEQWWLGKATDEEFLTNVAKELRNKLEI